jgi:hypothetical protein
VALFDGLSRINMYQAEHAINVLYFRLAASSLALISLAIVLLAKRRYWWFIQQPHFGTLRCQWWEPSTASCADIAEGRRSSMNAHLSTS